MKNRKAWSIAGTLAALALLAGCGQGSSPSATASRGDRAQAGSPQAPAGRRFATITVQAVTVKTGPLVTDNNTAGTVVPVTQSQVAAQVAGVVSRVLRMTGDWVKKGDVVVQMDDAQLKLAVRNAQAAVQNAKINLTVGRETASGSGPKLESQLKAAENALAAAEKTFDSQKATFDLGGISASELDNAQSQLQQAHANYEAAKQALDLNRQSDTQSIAQLQLAVDQASNQLQIAQLNLQYAAIAAPFSGQIASMNVSEGMYVGLNTSVFLLVSVDRQINFTVPPADAPRFKPGDIVSFTLDGRKNPVRIIRAPSAPIGGVVPMVASVPGSAPAPYGSVGTITYALTLGTGPLLPISALQTRADRNFVDTIVDGKAMERPIVILAESGSTAVVRGVEAGDQVIVSPPPGLLAGSSVQPVPAAREGSQ